MAHQVFPMLKRWNLLNERQRPGVGEIQAGESVLLAGVIERILREGVGSGAAERAENLAGVVGGLAKRVIGAQLQLVEKPRGAELELQPFVIGVGSIGAFA